MCSSVHHNGPCKIHWGSALEICHVADRSESPIQLEELERVHAVFQAPHGGGTYSNLAISCF